jgi:hypothetical protein
MSSCQEVVNVVIVALVFNRGTMEKTNAPYLLLIS